MHLHDLGLLIYGILVGGMVRKKQAHVALGTINFQCSGGIFLCSNTVNQLNFAAGNFAGCQFPSTLPILISGYDTSDSFLTKMLLHQNACISLNNGPIVKISIVPETREQGQKYFSHILISAKLNRT